MLSDPIFSTAFPSHCVVIPTQFPMSRSIPHCLFPDIEFGIAFQVHRLRAATLNSVSLFSSVGTIFRPHFQCRFLNPDLSGIHTFLLETY